MDKTPPRALLARLGRPARFGAAALVLLALPACSLRTSPEVTGSLAPVDLRDRHPIVLSDAPRSLELYPGPGGRLGERQEGDLAVFLADYRQNGRSALVVEAPDQGHGGAATRSILARHGVSPAAVHMRSYPAPHYSVAAPVRISFAKLQARVPHECGVWNDDFGVASARTNARNEPYWNLGCASQSNLAAQVADPLDLVRARPEGRIDTIKRTNAIEKVRRGEDPSTAYRSEQTSINRGVGN